MESKTTNETSATPTAADVVSSAQEERHEDGSPIERPIIAKMELENFKSYAGLKTIGPFHQRFNSIIGPNGSGKSNVIDAMMFVFGKRAKKLRLKKVSELIHNSAEFPNCTYARVNVHFVNVRDDEEGDGVTPVPGTECMISRIANKNNSSTYKINNKNATFSEVAECLSKYNIDLKNNRFLILQGEVELISQMKPMGQVGTGETGLLEYLEEIIGSNKFVEPIAKSNAEYDGAEEDRTQSKNRMRAAEKTREGLRGSRDDVIAFKSAQRSVATKRNILWHKKKILRANEALRLSKERTDMTEMRNDAAAEFKGEEDSLVAMSNEIQSFKKSHTKLEKEADDWREKYAAFERKDVKMREDLKHNKTEKKKMSKLAKKSELVANACREKIGQLEADAPQRDADVVEAKRAMAEAESQLEEIESTLKGKTEALRKELKEASKELKPLGKICDASKAEVEECRSEIDLVKDRSITARKKYEKLQRELQEASECVEGHGAAVKQLEDQITMKQERVVAAKEELVSVQSGEAQSQLDIESIRNKREELQSELGNAQATTGASRATGMLAALQSKEAGVGSDLLGRLGDLGGIDAKYDVAVSTAAGALNHLVTRTVDGAQRCIDYLRENELGRATFIVLEKIQYLENAMNSFKKEKAERLFDLIRPRDDEVRVAFYYACRDTLVAKSLDHASKIAYDGNKCVFRVVALTGELIELSGTMSGGGGRPRRGYMGEEATAFSAQSDEETKQAQMEVARIESALSAVEEDHRISCKQRDVLVRRKKELTKEIREVETWLKKATTKLSKMALNVKASQDILPDLTRNVEEVRPTIKPTEEEKLRVHELTEMLEEKETLYKAAHSNTAGLERRVGELQSSIMNVGGNDLKRAKKVFKNFANQLKEAEANVARSAVDIKALQKKIDTAEKEKVKAEKEHMSCVQTMTKTIEALKELDGHATECVETFNAIQTSEQEAKAAVVEKEKEYVVAAKELKKKSTKVEELDDAMKELDEKHERLQHELSVWEEKITKLMTTFNNDEDLTSNLDEEGEDGGEGGEGGEEGEDETKEDSSSSSRQFLLQTPTVKEIDEANIEELETAINTLESKITQLRDEIDMSALAAYNAAHKDWRTRAKEFDAATIARDAARTVYEALRKERLDTFMKGFSIITLKLKEMYQMITLGGDAELELVDTLDPFAEGIVFSVRPKGKSWKNIANLSGGEKTLSSLALVFALHHYKPTPLYVMDEIDAALDFRNVSIVANYIKERTKNAQFIIISLRNNMFELADRLVGIYKTNNSTKSVAINPQMIAMEAEKNLPAAKTMTKSADQAAPLSLWKLVSTCGVPQK